MRPLKFRQPIFVNGKFSSWHHWGFIDGNFFGPYISGNVTVERAEKESQQFTGSFSKSGQEIYDGDRLQSVCPMVNLISGRETGRFKTTIYEVRWEENKGRWGLWRNERFELAGLNKSSLLKWYEIIGNVKLKGGASSST